MAPGPCESSSGSCASSAVVDSNAPAHFVGASGYDSSSSSSGSISSDSSGSCLGGGFDSRFRGRGPRVPAKFRGDGGGRGPGGLPPWVRTVSDSILVVRGGGRVPGCAVLRSPTLPAVLAPPSPRGGEKTATSHLSRSQARLIIPRTISEYFECCRFARSHTAGLLPIHENSKTEDSVNFRELVRAFSEGLLGGRVFPPNPGDNRQSGDQDNSRSNQPPRRIPVSELSVGALMEGKIVRISALGLLVDVGATALGLLKRKDCQNVPRRLLRRGEVLSNLQVLSVDGEKGRFTLRVKSVDGSTLEELVYIDVLELIAGWASVDLPPAMLEYATEMSMRSPKSGSRKTGSQKMKSRGGEGNKVGGGARGGRGRGRGRGRGSASNNDTGVGVGAGRYEIFSKDLRSGSSTVASSSSSSVSRGVAATPMAGRSSGRRSKGRSGLRWRPINGTVVENKRPVLE
eukprot:TRINITY_DN61424_c0_g1_i1.p1 TRINITY_DN61424_c0_g1~~TRINITY_DN61424_c0_g1_i1.p1  ORF type:complete len:458 (+),score=59.92 TRINITY_DN61424_c0_g1_i1:176-1549(+)